ncbi:MAG: hypothetical protein ACM3ML_11390 [Micromonosporaceae bacterium]
MNEPGPPGPAEPESPGAAEQHARPVHPAAAASMNARRVNPWTAFMHAEQVAKRRAEGVHLPAWMRRTPGEPRWPVTLTVMAAIGLQVVLPDKLNALRYVVPVLECALLAGLIIANPVRIERRSRAVAIASIVLTLLITIANAASAVLLVRAILEGKAPHPAVALLGAGAAIWLTNVIAFALWYWEFDRGGPVHRAGGTSPYPDLMFPQMATPNLAPPDWEPRFVDYLYLSFTNATAFSPTDVMPLARWAKLTMLVQSGVSLALVVLVVARAVNILGA